MLAYVNFVVQKPRAIGVLIAILIASALLLIAHGSSLGEGRGKDSALLLQFGGMIFIWSLSVGFARSLGLLFESRSSQIAMMIVGPVLPVAVLIAAQIDTIFW
ncbi:hypothetical protein ACMA5I_08875 [Paracoccaceae bacterium GXU_MW_L88]